MKSNLVMSKTEMEDLRELTVLQKRNRLSGTEQGRLVQLRFKYLVCERAMLQEKLLTLSCWLLLAGSCFVAVGAWLLIA